MKLHTLDSQETGFQVSDTGSDVALVARVKRGETEAFSELVRRHERVVYNLALRFMRDPSSAEDMAQEAFLKAFRLLRSFRGDCSFTTWMYRVTCSVCLTEINRRRRRAEVSLHPQHTDRLEQPPVPGSAVSSDVPEQLRRCIDKLPDKYSKIISLYYLDDVPYEEITRLLEIPLGTLKTWMFRARKQLKHIIEKEMYAHEF